MTLENCDKQEDGEPQQTETTNNRGSATKIRRCKYGSIEKQDGDLRRCNNGSKEDLCYVEPLQHVVSPSKTAEGDMQTLRKKES